MSRRPLPRAALPLAACAFAAVALLPAPARAAAETGFLPVEEIRPGMTGTGRTVFEGEALEEFHVEILGVMRQAVGPDQDLILARLHGEKVEFTGVVAGMSGSPVYVGGRLIGALSYRIGTFAKEPIAGITPIADMLRAAPPPPPRSAGRAEGSPDLLGRFLAGERSAAPSARLAPAASIPGLGAATLEPIGVPLVCGGCDPGVLRYYAPIFESFGLEAVAGGALGAAAPAEAPAPALVPGSAIGGSLVRGSLNVAGIGTLTHVDRGRVYAFGHPLLGTGAIEMPMTQARVLLTFASATNSFKIANPTPPIGTIVRDGLTAIVGEVGPVPAALPLTVRVTGEAGSREFRYDIMRDRVWAPVLAALTTANSLVRTTEFEGDATLSVGYALAFEKRPAVRFEDLYAGAAPGQQVHTQVGNDVGGVVGLLLNNRFEDPGLRAVEIDVRLLAEAQVAAIDLLHVSRGEVRPGETFRVTAVVRPFRGEERQVAWDVTLPEDAAPGEAEIIVGGGPAIEALERRIVERRMAQASGVEDLIRLVAGQRRNASLYLRVARRARAAIVGGDVLPDLPMSVFSVLNNPRLSADSTLMNETTILELEKPLDVVPLGGRRVSVRIR